MQQGAPPNNAINSDVQKRRFALLLHAGYGDQVKNREAANPEIGYVQSVRPKEPQGGMTILRISLEEVGIAQSFFRVRNRKCRYASGNALAASSAPLAWTAGDREGAAVSPCACSQSVNSERGRFRR